MVRGNVETAYLQKILKVPGCCVDCQELAIKSAIVLFSWGQLPGEVPYSL